MEASVNGELLRIYDLIRRLQDDVTNLAKEFYETSAVSYDEISGTPETLSSFENDMNYISSEEVDLKIESIPPVDDSNYLKKKDEDSQECTILTHFKDITATTQKKDDCSDNVATTQFVHSLIEESSKSTEKYISGIYSRLDAVSSAQMKEAIKKALKDYYDSGEVDSKIELIISELYIPTKTSDLRNDSGFITIDDIPQSPVTSVNGLTGDVTIQIPTVPTSISSFTNDVGYITDPGVTSVNNQTGAVYVQENVQANWSSTSGLSAILNKPALKRVATTGSYNDLDDKPTIPTNISELNNDSNFATVSDVQNQVSNLIDNAPAVLDTLNELAAALGDDPSFATTIASQINTKYTKPATGIPVEDLDSDVQASLNKADTALQSFTETDPTVPAWAKASTKPSYTAAEVGALPNDTVLFSGDYNDLSNKPTIPTIPTNVSAFTNDAGYLTSYTETDPTVPAWAKASTKPSYTASEVGALPDDTQLFSGDYNDLSNKPTIPAAVTESTVSGWGFTKNTGTYSKPSGGIPKTDLASAVQTSLGKADTALQSYTETDPVFTASVAHGITQTDISNWNSKSDFSGSYNDLTNKPTIPTVPTNVSAFTNDAGYLTGFTESDPTVPAWAKAASKPTYTASEVGALPSNTPLFSGNYNDLTNKPSIPTVPTNVSAFTNDAGYLTSFTESDPTVPSWAKTANKPTYTAAEVGALPDTTVIPTIPTNVSVFTNDAGYLTGSDVVTVYSGSATPSSSLGSNGDIYIQTS